jgi:pyruvate/oxaloacetate carboxyltransferase
VQKKAAERLLALEHPAIDAMARILDPKQTAWTRATRLSASTVAAIAKDVLDRTGHKQPEKLEIEPRKTIDVRRLSTGLLRQLVAEIKQQQARDRLPLTPGRPADERPED